MRSQFRPPRAACRAAAVIGAVPVLRRGSVARGTRIGRRRKLAMFIGGQGDGLWITVHAPLETMVQSTDQDAVVMYGCLRLRSRRLPEPAEPTRRRELTDHLYIDRRETSLEDASDVAKVTVTATL